MSAKNQKRFNLRLTAAQGDIQRLAYEFHCLMNAYGFEVVKESGVHANRRTEESRVYWTIERKDGEDGYSA